MWHIRITVSVASLLFISSSAAFSQGLITQKVLSLNMAQRAAQGAIEKCRADGYHVSVTVLDGGGLLKTFLRDDGSSPGSIDVSRRKAYAALIFRRTSAEAAKAWAAHPPAPNIPGTVLLGGGVPIKAGNEFVGAIGISGGPNGKEEEACANAGVAKIADELK
ncbi:MAG TPA: heme-binding protein [Terriglobia bacterium]|nr:heme-binding protein [Terriglobia bacterium]